ncbi:MAG: methyltransferase domain-containing protein [Methylococcales bacterium]|nr:methyltransferase domain-containing protein [Methylococcales bacterium]
MSSAKGYVAPDYLSVIANLFNQIKERSYTLMHILPGHQVLDLGCGPGTDTIRLASIVGGEGMVIGADHDASMVAAAEQRAEQAGVKAIVSHLCVEATALPFETDYFDSCRSERLFQHLEDPGQVLAEMVRVTKPNGWVVVVDTDWGSLSTDSDETDIERRLTRFLTEGFLNNGYSGRKLNRLFKQQNLLDVAYEVFPVAISHYAFSREVTQADRVEQLALEAGVISHEELQRWHRSLEQADKNGAYFCSVNIVLLVGRKQ